MNETKESMTQKVVALAQALGTLLLILGVIGWVANVYQVFQYTGEHNSPMFIARVLSIVLFPIGFVLGWL